MTVNELIVELEKLDPTLSVFVDRQEVVGVDRYLAPVGGTYTGIREPEVLVRTENWIYSERWSRIQKYAKQIGLVK